MPILESLKANTLSKIFTKIQENSLESFTKKYFTDFLFKRILCLSCFIYIPFSKVQDKSLRLLHKIYLKASILETLSMESKISQNTQSLF